MTKGRGTGRAKGAAAKPAAARESGTAAGRRRARTPAVDVLALAAHPDDAEIACGGLLAMLGRRGYRTAVVDLTEGELASSGDVATRRHESEEAAEILGLDARRNLALPDGGLAHADRAQLSAVVGALREFRPFLVLAPFPRCSHPDHVEAGLLVRRAAHLAGIRKWAEGAAPSRPGVVVSFESRIPIDPTFLVDVSDVAFLKQRAIHCHRSQFDRAAGTAETVLNDPGFLGARLARTRWLGTLIGVTEAEPYILEGPLPVADPVALFRAAPGPLGRMWGL
jgi:N-acetylglucosamine malate deacetylase 1